MKIKGKKKYGELVNSEYDLLTKCAEDEGFISKLFQFYQKNYDEYINLIKSSNYPDHEHLINRVQLIKYLYLGITKWNEKNFDDALKCYKHCISLREGFYKHYGTKRSNGYSFKLWSDDPNLTLYMKLYSYLGRKNNVFVFNNIDDRFSELEKFSRFRHLIKEFWDQFNKNTYFPAYRTFRLAEKIKREIKNTNYFIEPKEEEAIKVPFKIVFFHLIKKIKKIILDFSTRFTRLSSEDICEKSEVEDEFLVIEVMKKMLENGEIYGEYFVRTKSLVFDQQANINEIDELIGLYKQWEKEEKDKI